MEKTFDIKISSNSSNYKNLTLSNMLNLLSDHFATIGLDIQPITITDSISGNIISQFTEGQETCTELITLDKNNQSYTISQLLDLYPYLN